MILITVTLKNSNEQYFISQNIFDFIEKKSNELTTIFNDIITINYKKINNQQLASYYHKIRKGF